MFEWTKEQLCFRKAAAEYNRFEEHLAEALLPYLPAGAHICDAGCGTGHLSLALAERGYPVTAVDICPDALSILRQNAQARGLNNIQIIEGDLFAMQPPQPYDAMVFCFFGNLAETLQAVSSQCRGRVILVKKAWQTRRFTTKEQPLRRFTFRLTCEELEARGIPYEKKIVSLETGQPFRSRAEAERFFALYEKETPPDRQTIRERLLRTDSPEFPYYLPSCGEVGILVIETGDIPGHR